MRKRVILALASGVAVATPLSAAAFAVAVQGPPTAAPASSPSVSKSESNAPQRLAAEAAGDLPCSVNATPSLSRVDERISEMAAVNGFSQPLAEGDKALSRQAAISLAGETSSDPKSAANATAAAIMAPYSVAGAWFSDANPLIAPDRCVWVVTVAAPFTPTHGLAGAKRPTYDRYSVIFDAASGQGIGLTAGPGVPDVITGEGIGD